jgi:hypothetical protein
VLREKADSGTVEKAKKVEKVRRCEYKLDPRQKRKDKIEKLEVRSKK